MKYRCTDKDGKKYFIEINGDCAMIGSDDGVIDLTAEHFLGCDKNGRAVYENDTVILPKMEFTSEFLGVTFKANGGETSVNELARKNGMTRGFLSRIISHCKLKGVCEHNRDLPDNGQKKSA